MSHVPGQILSNAVYLPLQATPAPLTRLGCGVSTRRDTPATGKAAKTPFGRVPRTRVVAKDYF